MQPYFSSPYFSHAPVPQHFQIFQLRILALPTSTAPHTPVQGVSLLLSSVAIVSTMGYSFFSFLASGRRIEFH